MSEPTIQSPDISKALHGRGAIKLQTLKALHAEWRKMSPNLDSELPERDLRMQWTTDRLRLAAPCGSWNNLSEGQARRLLRLMRLESGSAQAYLTLLVAEAAAELWVGLNWSEFGWPAACRSASTPVISNGWRRVICTR